MTMCPSLEQASQYALWTSNRPRKFLSWKCHSSAECWTSCISRSKVVVMLPNPLQSTQVTSLMNLFRHSCLTRFFPPKVLQPRLSLSTVVTTQLVWSMLLSRRVFERENIYKKQLVTLIDSPYKKRLDGKILFIAGTMPEPWQKKSAKNEPLFWSLYTITIS